MPRFSCERAAGYAAAMLINIKEPSQAGEVWIGFSEVPLSLKVRQNYAARPELLNQRFTRLNASNGQSDRVMALTDGAIQGAIVDYDVERGRMLEGLRGNPHRPVRSRWTRTARFRRSPHRRMLRPMSVVNPPRMSPKLLPQSRPPPRTRRPSGR